MICSALDRKGDPCGADATTQFGIFPCCQFHKDYSAKFSMDRSRESYRKGYNEGYGKAKLEETT